MSDCRCITRWTVVSVALTLSFARPTAAQTRESLSLDATIGASAGSGRRQYYGSGDFAGEVTLGLRFHPERTVAAIGALSVGGRSHVGADDAICRLVDGSSGTSPRCAQHFPGLAHVGVLGGVERRGVVSLRALAGPAFYAGEGAPGFGAQAQFDGAIGFSHLALVGAVRGSWIARVTGETFLFRSLEFGFRVR